MQKLKSFFSRAWAFVNRPLLNAKSALLSLAGIVFWPIIALWKALEWFATRMSQWPVLVGNGVAFGLLALSMMLVGQLYGDLPINLAPEPEEEELNLSIANPMTLPTMVLGSNPNAMVKDFKPIFKLQLDFSEATGSGSGAFLVVDRPSNLFYKDRFTARGICTVFVISPYYVATAAHCVMNSWGEIHGRFKVETPFSTIPVELVGANGRLDTALMYGDFTAFEPMKIHKKAPQAAEWIGAFTASYGFAGGVGVVGAPENTPTKHIGRLSGPTNFHIQLADAGLIPGMSGGPTTINFKEGEYVIGINSYVQGPNSAVARLDANVLRALLPRNVKMVHDWPTPRIVRKIEDTNRGLLQKKY